MTLDASKPVTTLAVFDTETTGFTYNNVIELAAVIIGPNGETYTWYERCRPSTPIEAEAEGVHGISNEMVAGCRPDTEVVAEFWADINQLADQFNSTLVLAGHNNHYDNRVIHPYINLPENIPKVCTLRLSRIHHPHAPDHKLGTMHQVLGCSGDFQAHSALDDCYMSLNILKYYLGYTKKTYQQLAVELENPVLLTIMPNGKHKGRPFSVIPMQYIDYMLGLDDLDPDIAFTLQHERTRRGLRR